jgi:hypothetical protein
MPELPSLEELKQLPLRAIVAYAARCVRRAEPPFKVSASEVPAIKIERESFWNAIRVGEAFARREECDIQVESAEAVAEAHGFGGAVQLVRAVTAVEAAIRATRIAASAERDLASATDEDAAARAARVAAQVKSEVIRAAEEASVAADRSARHQSARGGRPGGADAAARADFQILLELTLGQFPDLGRPIDPSEKGPLGPLWPYGSPFDEVPGTGDAELLVEIQVPADASDDELLAMVRETVWQADEIHRQLGGHGLKVERLAVLEGVPVPAGGPRG